MRSFGRSIWRQSYLLLWIGIVAVYAWRVVGSTLGRDLFEHAASIRELATHPLAPLHPIYAVNEPHSLYSPYAFVLAMLERSLGTDPMAVLAVAGFVNALLLAIGLRAFVREFSASPLAPTLTLVFALVLWGILPPAWSGMLHLQSLSYGLPYPSTFVLGAVLLALVQVRRFLRVGGWVRLVVILAVAIFALLSHPFTSLLLYVGSAAFLLEAIGRAPWSRLGAVLTVGVAAVPLALPWPFFPFFDLVLAQEAAFEGDHLRMYTSAAQWTFLAWPGVVVLALRARANPRDPLAVMFGLTVLLYLFGWVIGAYNLGRLLSVMMLLVHVALGVGVADWLAARERSATSSARDRLVTRWGAGFLVLLAALGVARIGLADNVSYAEIARIAGAVPQDEVVMADLETAYRVPAWGGKVVGWRGSLPFVADHAQRQADVNRFFEDDTSEAERRAILARWGARWVLFDRDALGLSDQTVEDIEGMGTVIAGQRQGPVVLVHLDDAPS